MLIYLQMKLSLLKKQTVKVISFSEQETVGLCFSGELRCQSPLSSPSVKAACQYLTLSLFACLEIESDGTI